MLANNISKARKRYAKSIDKKVTQDAAAEMFGVAYSTYRRWEQGKGNLDGKVLSSLADVYGCSVDYLLCRTNDPTPYSKSTMTPDEESLLDSYRSTNGVWQAEIRDYAANAAKRHPKSDQGEIQEEAKAG